MYLLQFGKTAVRKMYRFMSIISYPFATHSQNTNGLGFFCIFKSCLRWLSCIVSVYEIIRKKALMRQKRWKKFEPHSKPLNLKLRKTTIDTTKVTFLIYKIKIKSIYGWMFTKRKGVLLSKYEQQQGKIAAQMWIFFRAAPHMWLIYKFNKQTINEVNRIKYV